MECGFALTDTGVYSGARAFVAIRVVNATVTIALAKGQSPKSQSSNQTFACARRRDMRFIIVRRIIASLVSGLRS